MPCNPPKTTAETKWPYEEYYLGERDEENRKNGTGTHHWTGAESLECYNGHMLRDTMHGEGDYRWRYLGPDNLATTYEGRFYNNRMHGYGLMSYPDGRVFNGLFHKNIRWGPGVESHACLREDVGLWHGYQLIRLAWRPELPSVAIDLASTPIGTNTITPHRILLTKNVKIIGEVNSALELLKKSGCEPLAAAEKWSKLYPKTCTDLSSQLCQVDAFDRAYYVNGVNTLSEVTAFGPDKDISQTSTEINDPDKTTYYAWNNNQLIIHMMKHSFTHEEQRGTQRLSLENILSGPRSSFKQPGKHEMDCRTLILASYLGHISNVATLINECDVMPDVTDVQGNSVIMYAACGDQPETIHFLVEAGADVDVYNDACCTPLGITLLRYALVKRGVTYNAMLQALLPPPAAVGPPPPDEHILEWKISRHGRDILSANGSTTGKSHHKHVPTKKASVKELSVRKKTVPSKQDLQNLTDKDINATTDAFAEDKHIYDKFNTEYLIRVAEAFSERSEVSPIPYIFEVNDMCKDVELLNDEDTKKTAENKGLKKIASKVVKAMPMKPSRDTMFPDKEDTLVDTMEQLKQEKMARIMATILQLLSDGADPLKVRCPQPPLFIAAVSGCAELINLLFMNGADINEVYPQVYGYTTLDIAVSGPLTDDNLEVIRVLLECGADADHRLKVPSPPTAPAAQSATNNVGNPPIITEVEGPTLLHAVLAKKIDSEADNTRPADVRDQLLELLLQYGCDPIAQYKGRSAVEVALNKSLDLFDIFLNSPRTDLNAVINDSNQTILVKMFYLPFCKTMPLPEKLQTLTNLLLFGADPLLKCQNGNDEYGNLFCFVKSVLCDMESPRAAKTPSPTGSKNAKKDKSEVKKLKKNVKLAASKATGTKATGPKATSSKATPKPVGKVADDSHGDYKQAVDLVVECARLLYIRWLQGTLIKELIEVVNKTKILRSTSITKVWQRPSITFEEKEFTEREVARFTREHKLATMSTPDMVPAIRPYVTPELLIKEEEKFNVCFECIMPLGDAKIPCYSCNLIGFCSFECMKTNIDRINCHPCSDYLKEKYFPTPEETESHSEEI